jgi:hypothetical protein
MGDGIDWKATIQSKARRDDSIYIKKNLRPRGEASNIGLFTPTVYIFDELEYAKIGGIHDGNITQRSLDLGNDHLITADFPEPDYVYSIFYATTETRHICDEHISEEILSSVIFLCTTSWMGTERYNKIIERSKRFHCRIAIEEDDELKGFTYPENFVSCGVKYAEKSLIVVASDSWVPSHELTYFAKSRGVKIISVPISRLSWDLVDRMRHLHFISTELKKYGNQEAILERFLPELFE